MIEDLLNLKQDIFKNVLEAFDEQVTNYVEKEEDIPKLLGIGSTVVVDGHGTRIVKVRRLENDDLVIQRFLMEYRKNLQKIKLQIFLF